MLLVKTMFHCWALNSQKPGRFPSLKGENTVIDVPGHTSARLFGNLDLCSPLFPEEPPPALKRLPSSHILVLPGQLVAQKLEEKAELIYTKVSMGDGVVT